MDSNNSSNQLNNEQLHVFFKGWQKDVDEHYEKPESYDDAWNCRLYSHNGTLALASMQGTRTVYENQNIVKYLGYYAFKDELVVFGKGNLQLSVPGTVDKTIKETVVDDFEVTADVGTNVINGIDFASHYNTTDIVIQVPEVIVDEDDFIQNVTPVDPVTPIDDTFGGLFTSLPYLPTTVCAITGDQPPINNVLYNDFILTFTYDSNRMLVANFRYVGWLNFPIDGKITTEGVEENIYYKRVYFSNYYNPTRVVNLKDNKLSQRNPEEFNKQTKGTLLNPRIKSIEESGQLPAMTVFYVMKLITENGQTSDFSPTSPATRILKGSTAFEIKGGDVSEITNKSVIVECYIPDYQNFKTVQLVAIEFEAKDIPTSIRLVGQKPVAPIVQFQHFGSEPEFSENISLDDIFKNSLSWKYNADFSNKNNKLLVCGLRNDPSYVNSKNVDLDFALHSFTPDGQTHNSLLNPDPFLYNYISADMNDSFFYVQRRLFRRIEVFGNFTMKLENIETNEFYEFSQPMVNYIYVDYTAAMLQFLLDIQSDPDFQTKFPNLEIVAAGTKILFQPLNPAVVTDFYPYNLTFSTNQVIMDMDNDIEFKNYAWPATDPDREDALVYGAVSNGWFKGNGVRVTMHTEKTKVLTKNDNWMLGGGHPLQIETPSLTKYAMKDEVYRAGIQWYKDGNKLFVTVLGDLKIPAIGMKKRELNQNGQIIKINENYTNFSVVDNEMFAEGIKLQFDIRINCKLSQEVDAYQIVHVARTEENRTILAQGLSGPCERNIPFSIQPDLNTQFVEIVTHKWGLPSNGGPVYDSLGLQIWDIDPNNISEDAVAPKGCRVMTSRKNFYFDAPDLIYNKVSDKLMESCNVEYIETLATDHDRHNIVGGYSADTSGLPGTQVYFPGGAHSQDPAAFCVFGLPKFSQKIPPSLIAGNIYFNPNYVNVSVFAVKLKKRVYGAFQQLINPSDSYVIDRATNADEGEVIAAYKMNDTFPHSNNAVTFASPGWFYQVAARTADPFVGPNHTLLRVNNVASGRKTAFIKTKTNFFSPGNIAQTPYIINSQVNFGTSDNRMDVLFGFDAYIISNLRRKNLDSVYGGRTEYAYASNEYVPLSQVIPIISNRITSQQIYVEGDTYCTLYIRSKTSFANSGIPVPIEFQWSRHDNGGSKKTQYNHYNAWCYACVLETTVEPRLSNAEEFYHFATAINFTYREKFNEAYLQENDLRKSIPKPYNFKDDPNLNNIIAASLVKLNGDFIDAWTQFPTNEFYEIDKNKGSVLNLAKENDDIFAIQELQISSLFIDEKQFITPDEGGAAIQVNQGNGTSISGHKVLAQFGTSRRRAVVDSPFGFIFYDERKNEIVKITTPLLLQNNLLLYLKQFFDKNQVVDVEGYYDEQFKETNLRFRTLTGINFVISYNEMLKCFNGRMAYDNDLYMVFQEKTVAPHGDSKIVDELNTGDELVFFGQKKTMRVRVISSPMAELTKIFKGIAIYINVEYPIIKAIFETSLGTIRTVMGTHHWYKNREGVHTIPAKNQTDYNDIRGEWCGVEVEAESKNNKKVIISSLMTFFRKSHK